jgi:hypothetical protein
VKCIHNFGAITSKEKATYNTYVVFRWEDNIKIDFKDVGSVGVGWICRDSGRILVNPTVDLRVA